MLTHIETANKSVRLKYEYFYSFSDENPDSTPSFQHNIPINQYRSIINIHTIMHAYNEVSR